jgi:hypothetical protein
MASDYGLNFGFRRSDESVRVSEGRLKTPATGTFRLGSLVTFDPANPGYLKAAAANQVGEGATVGLLVQEEVWLQSIYSFDVRHIDSFSLGVAKNNAPSVISSGAGTKVWLANTLAQSRADGRQIAAVTMFTPTGIGVMDYLAWDGSKFIKGTGVADSMLRVTSIDTTTAGAERLEAVLTR